MRPSGVTPREEVKARRRRKGDGQGKVSWNRPLGGVMPSFHLSLGAHLLLWTFPLALTTVTVILAIVLRPTREEAP